MEFELYEKRTKLLKTWNGCFDWNSLWTQFNAWVFSL